MSNERHNPSLSVYKSGGAVGSTPPHTASSSHHHHHRDRHTRSTSSTTEAAAETGAWEPLGRARLVHLVPMASCGRSGVRRARGWRMTPRRISGRSMPHHTVAGCYRLLRPVKTAGRSAWLRAAGCREPGGWEPLGRV